MVDWLVTTMRSYPELAIFLALAIGFTVGPLKLAGFSLGNVTATLIAAVIIGQLGITISPNVKAAFFIMFIFAIGYGVGPQFVSGFGIKAPQENTWPRSRSLIQSCWRRCVARAAARSARFATRSLNLAATSRLGCVLSADRCCGFG